MFSSTLGNVISAHDAVDLPLNGRDLTQLGLLQPGVAPMTFGLLQAGGIARASQAYAVNGQPPESNNYLLDGAPNVDSVNGGFALRIPLDAVREFRILTSQRAAGIRRNQRRHHLRGHEIRHQSASMATVYDFLRNNAFDARNFFAASTEPLHQQSIWRYAWRPDSPR